MMLPVRRFATVADFAFFLILGLLLLPSLSSAQVTSRDPNFTPAILKTGLSSPDGVVFRPPTGDLLITQSGNNQVSSVNPNSGAVTLFANASSGPDKIAVRSSDGLVAVTTSGFGPVAFFSSTGISQGTPDLGATLIATFPIFFSSGDRACLAGLSFDTMGNLFVAAGPGSTDSNGCLPNSTWAVFEFPGVNPATATPIEVVPFPVFVVIQDMVFTAAPLNPVPGGASGTLYALDSEGANVYEIELAGGCEGLCANTIANLDPDTNPRGIAVDPLLGDVYVTQFDGTQILKIPARGQSDNPPPPATFAFGFTGSDSGDTLRLAFDTTGNLYVNEIGNGNLWKFTRASGATAQLPLLPGIINTFTFVNPNPAMSDQIQTILIPASAKLNGAAFIQDIFVSVDPGTLNSTLSGGTTGDPSFFGGTSVPSGTTCAQVPSAHSNCVVVVQKCYDAHHNPFEICPVQEPSTSPDLIQLSFTYSTAPSLPNPAFLIGFDNGNGQDITDITIADCCSGGTKSLCSKTFDASLPNPNGDADFSLAITPDPIPLNSSSSTSATVTVTSLNAFSATIFLSVGDVPPGFTASLTAPSVSLPASGTAPDGLTVGISSSATTATLATIISNLLAAGCIDNGGIANAFTSKLSAAQADISSGQIKTAINVLMALRDQVQAQSGKHLAASCTTTFPLIVQGSSNQEEHSASANIVYSPSAVIATNVTGLITSLKMSVSSADPITGFVTDSSGNGLQGAVLGIFDSLNHLVTTSSTSDVTGFYYFSNTSLLGSGAAYTVQVTTFPGTFTSSTPASQPFTWGGKGLAFNFTLQ